MRASPWGPLTAVITTVLAVGLFSPASAAAGIVGGGFSDEAPSGGCYRADCGSYAIQAPSTSGPVRITPHDGRERSTGEGAFADFAAPAWPHSPVQGYQVHGEFGGSVLGQNWEAVICRPGPASSGLCDGGVQVFRGAGQTTLVMVLPTPEQRVRVALKYIGSSTRPNSAVIALAARLSWFEVDSQPPAVTALAGGRALAGSLVLNGEAAADGAVPIELSAEDNTGVAAGQIVVDGIATAVGADGGEAPVRDGVHRVQAGMCDIAAPANCAGSEAVVSVDTARPRVSLPPTLAFADPRPTVQATVSDPTVNGYRSGVAAVQMRLAEQPADAEVESTGDAYELTPTQPLGEGRYPFDVSARDAAGNQGTSADAGGPERELVVDLHPPAAVAVDPPPGAKLASGPAQIAARLTDSVGVTAARMLLDGNQVNADFSEPDLTFFAEQKICPGGHTVQAIATDAVGRTAEARWTFTIRGRLSKRCARIACANARHASRRLRREIRHDRRSELKNRRALRRTKTNSKRAVYRRRVARWQTEYRSDTRELRRVRRASRRACGIARP